MAKRIGVEQVSNGDEMRPDGRAPTPETRKLRVAARALRYHLDTLPIDYDLDVSGDRFLAGLAFMFARQRYDCADSMIGAGFGGTVLGSIARSLFVDGLRWLWIGEQPERRRSLLGDLLEERNRICVLLEETDASWPVLPRWFMPLPDVADLTGQSLTWLDAPSMPSEDELVHDFLARSGTGGHAFDDVLQRHTKLHVHQLRSAQKGRPRRTGQARPWTSVAWCLRWGTTTLVITCRHTVACCCLWRSTVIRGSFRSTPANCSRDEATGGPQLRTTVRAAGRRRMAP